MLSLVNELRAGNVGGATSVVATTVGLGEDTKQSKCRACTRTECSVPATLKPLKHRAAYLLQQLWLLLEWAEIQANKPNQDAVLIHEDEHRWEQSRPVTLEFLNHYCATIVAVVVPNLLFCSGALPAPGLQNLQYVMFCPGLHIAPLWGRTL